MKKARETHHTLALAMIMKDEVDDLDRIIKNYGKYFDKIYVTVTDKKTYSELLKKFPAHNELVELSYFKWIDHFGKARLYNQKQIKTDYWMWIDLDDEIEGAEHIPAMIKYMVAKDIDAIILQYEYLRRVNLSDPGQIFWRERIIKASSKLKWRDEAVHENINVQSDTKHVVLSETIIKHRKTTDQMPASVERNRLILEKDWLHTHRALTAWHLGATLRESGDYEGAIEKLLFVAENSASKAYRFAAWQSLCECYYQTDQLDAALNAVSKCMTIDSDHPEPWYQRFAVYRAMGRHDLAMQSAETAMTKRATGELAIILGQDPSWHQYKFPFDAAQAYLSLGNIERAYELFQQVKRIAPGYIEEQSAAMGVNWNNAFKQAYKNRLK
jgi:tetratricopeptide (TPR) repeat protein